MQLLISLGIVALLFIVGAAISPNKNSGSEAPAEKAAPAAEAEVINEPVAENVTETDGGELIAILTAAVLASLGREYENKIQIKSYRRIPSTSPAWNLMGRNEYILNKL